MFLELLHHGVGHILGLGMPRKLVRRGKEETLQAPCVGNEIADRSGVVHYIHEFLRSHKLAGLQVPRDVKHRLALAHHERLFKYLAACQRPKDIALRNRMIEEIFARHDGAPRMLPRVELESNCAADHTVSLQKISRRA
ncbi:MAG: hypothetical protein AUG07_00005 [Acidobacteria bacterium 13_1_20CM_2_60_10]|nr:MAG: hypothetical protein AUG07_00005 [Acidobacteria bacterium 13_1_20CM_2_60_10]